MEMKVPKWASKGNWAPAYRQKRRPRYAPLKMKESVLDAYNEKIAEEGRQLHPTKGYQKKTSQQLLAATITEEMKQGNRFWNMKTIKAAFAGLDAQEKDSAKFLEAAE